MRRITFAFAILLLVQPPVAAEVRVLTIPSCGGGTQRMAIPGDPHNPKERRECAKACHAVTDRRGKNAGMKRGCC